MDYKELLKKYWFVLLVGIVLIVFVIAWALDDNKNTAEEKENTVQTKEVDGKYVLFEMDGSAYTADDFYNLIDTSSSIGIALDDLFGYFANKEIKSTEEIKALATNNAQYLILNYTESDLEQLMRSNGLKKYGNITAYYEEMIKKQELMKKYILNHEEDILKPYIEGKTYKKISHILVKVADVTESTDETTGTTTHTANPTAEESTKLQSVLDMLKTDTFANTAIKYSDDGSASVGGLLGCQTDEQASSAYVPEFADAVTKLGYGQQSEVITTQYGYHIIYVEEPTNEDLVDDQTILEEIIDGNNSENYIKLLIEYSDKYNVEIVNDEIIEIFDNYRTTEETTESTGTTESEVSE